MKVRCSSEKTTGLTFRILRLTAYVPVRAVSRSCFAAIISVRRASTVNGKKQAEPDRFLLFIIEKTCRLLSFLAGSVYNYFYEGKSLSASFLRYCDIFSAGRDHAARQFDVCRTSSRCPRGAVSCQPVFICEF